MKNICLYLCIIISVPLTSTRTLYASDPILAISGIVNVVSGLMGAVKGIPVFIDDMGWRTAYKPISEKMQLNNSQKITYLDTQNQQLIHACRRSNDAIVWSSLFILSQVIVVVRTQQLKSQGQ